MSNFLLELRSEEIPARMQKGARAELEKLFRREMDSAGVKFGDLTIWTTPRRLALIARDLPQATEAVSEEAKGPPEGAPDQALDGFCRKNGITRDQLELRDVKGRMTYFAVKDIPGRAVADLLAEAIPAIIRDFSWPKSMRWGDASISSESLRWVRPLSGIVALLGDDVIDCEVHGVTSGSVTLGHRFHHHGDITIGNADDYAVKLRAGHVIVDHAERQDMIRAGAAKAAADAGLVLVEDEGLVIENAGLTEWPVPLLGRFEEEFLGVPPETIQLTARVNQKYFVCEDGTGKLANAFICTANVTPDDGGAMIVDGNRKVLAARLSDARFFWDVDRKTSLVDHAKKLERITFHDKLGTVADKVERVAKLARWLSDEGIVPNADPDLAEQAARLCKADLVTEMVGEFPELQGLMGGYYARAEGLPDAVADAIRDHYKPVGQGDDVPTAPVTVAVSLADKLDTLLSFFAINEKPTGSKDPFALRRAGIAVISLLNVNSLRGVGAAVWSFAKLQLHDSNLKYATLDEELRERQKNEPSSLVVDENSADYMKQVGQRESIWQSHKSERDQLDREQFQASNDALAYGDAFEVVFEFLIDRLKVQQREAGVRHDLIDAVFALGGEDDLVRLLARVHALQSFITTEDGTNLLAGYKRAANILKKEDWFSPSVTPAKAGVHSSVSAEGEMDSGLRRNDDVLEPHTGEEDPLAGIDDPELGPILRAGMEQHAHSYTPEPAEKSLIDALDAAEPTAAAAIEKEDFAAAMSALASLRAPIDAFFDQVTVNDADEAKRSARLDLLARFRVAVHNVADFSKIEG